MKPARELVRLAPALWFWESYDPKAKVQLFASALATADGIFLVDPIPLDDFAAADLAAAGPIAGIVVTNANHSRGTREFATQWPVPVIAHAAVEEEGVSYRRVHDGEAIASNLFVITLPGGAPGEIALVSSARGGAVIVGDALIHFAPHGFNFLPDKYCTDPKELRRSIRKLLAFDFEKMLFAHGEPIAERARVRLAQLLDAEG